MFTTGNTHLKYRKHHVHSAAHKLKIRSSHLVLTTAGTDLDSTDRAAIGGAKNSSASEPLKRPILSLWNSRGINVLCYKAFRAFKKLCTLCVSNSSSTVTVLVLLLAFYFS